MDGFPYSLEQVVVDLPTEGSTHDRIQEVELPTSDIGPNSPSLRIRFATDELRLGSASSLVKRMYSRRGYDTSSIGTERFRRTTLVGELLGRPVGTLTLNLDTPDAGLPADATYPDILDQLRASGHTLCEPTHFAVDHVARPEAIIAPLFHVTFILCRMVSETSDCIVEVNPRHVPFYVRSMGFSPCGEERLCDRVLAPSVLLRVELDKMEAQIRKYAGRPDKRTRSYFAHFLPELQQTQVRSQLSRRLFPIGNAPSGLSPV